MLRVEKDCVELQVKLQEVQKRLQTEQSTKMEYQTFTEEQVITIKRLRDENFKLKKHVSTQPGFALTTINELTHKIKLRSSVINATSSVIHATSLVINELIVPRQIEELKLEKYKSSSENGTVENSEEERLNALVSSVAHRYTVYSLRDIMCLHNLLHL